MIVSEDVSQCAPVGRHVVDATVGRLIEVQLDPIGQRRSVDGFRQLKRQFFVLEPDVAAVSVRRPPRHWDMPHVTTTHNENSGFSRRSQLMTNK